MSKRKIRVLECIRQGQIGGGESHLLSLVENLDRSVFDPVVLSFTEGPMIDRLNQLSVPTHVIPTLKPFDVTKWNKVRKLVKQYSFDLIHAHGTRAASNVLWAAKRMGIPIIYTVHGWSFHPDQKPLVRKIRIMGERYITSRTDLNISVSSSNQQSGKSYIPSFSSIVVNNGIDRNKFNPELGFPDIRKEFDIPDNKLLILFIARFTSHKQPLTLIKAFEKAVQENPELHLLMIGDGDEKEEAIRLIAEKKLEAHITLSKFRQDVPSILSAADVFVLPSLWEGLPIGLLEAMSMGKAVIASRVDGTIEVVEDRKSGWLIEPGNIEELKGALLGLASNKNLRDKLSLHARERVRDRFDAGQMTKEIQNIYLQVISSH